MLIDDRSLGFAESDKIDEVREYLDESIMCRFRKIRKCEVVDAAL